MNRRALSILVLSILPVTARRVDAAAPRIDWYLEPRFGLDRDGDGLLDVPNSFEYVQALEGPCGGPGPAPRFCVTFAAAGSVDPAGIQAYRWTVEGEGVRLEHESRESTYRPEGGLPEGIYEVTLTIEGEGGPATARRRVPVEDLVLACLGDSYGSGEGNPERALGSGLAWADDGAGAAGTPAARQHESARRSTLAAAAQVAFALERADPRSSVTFIFLAESGGTLKRDSLRQAEELARLAGGRRVDALLLSFGGNDVGFSGLVIDLVKASRLLAALPNLTIPGVDIDIGYNYLRKLEGLWAEGDLRLAELPGRYDQLQQRLDELGVEVLNTYITEYPDPSGRSLTSSGVERCDRVVAPSCEGLEAAGTNCAGAEDIICRNWSTISRACGVLEDLIHPLEIWHVFSIDVFEQDRAAARFVEPLNDAVRAAAARHQWTYVGGIADAFHDGHGECMPYAAPYRGSPFPAEVPEDVSGQRWFRSVEDSLAIQASFYGAVHPNEYGHRSVKEAVLDHLLLPVDVAALGVVDPDDEIREAVALGLAVEGRMLVAGGEIGPSSDVDLFTVSVPSAGRLEITAAAGSTACALRLFAASGEPLMEEAVTGGLLEASVPGPGDYVLGISGPRNTGYDAGLGLGDAPGGAQGPYRLSVRFGASPAAFQRGDVNGDGAIDLADPVATLGFLFLGSDPPGCLDAADADDSGDLDISDSAHELSFLFLGGPRPPAPSGECGLDPTADGLDCVGAGACR